MIQNVSGQLEMLAQQVRSAVVSSELPAARCALCRGRRWFVSHPESRLNRSYWAGALLLFSLLSENGAVQRLLREEFQTWRQALQSGETPPAHSDGSCRFVRSGAAVPAAGEPGLYEGCEALESCVCRHAHLPEPLPAPPASAGA